MKLNLLPVKVKSEGSLGGAIATAIFLAVIGFVLAILMIVKSKGDLDNSVSNNADAMQKATAADTESKKADAIMADTNVGLLVRNVNLAKAMELHSTVYPDLYDQVRGYIPGFLRVTSISAAPVDGTTSTITITGVIDSYQHYADVMLALWRIPGATSVSRSGYQLNDTYVPALTPDDQTGRPIKPGESNLSDDPLQRLSAMQANAGPIGFDAAGNFGGDPTATRFAAPGETAVTLVVTVNRDLQTPDPQATLTSPLTVSSPVPPPASPGTPPASPGASPAAGDSSPATTSGSSD